MEKTHLRDTRYFRRCCSSLKHSNLKSVNQGPNARVWAHTQILQTFLWHASTDTRWRFRLPLSVTPCSHRAGWQISACPPTHHPRHDHFLDRFFQGTPSTDPLERSWRHSQCWEISCVGHGQPLALKLLPQAQRRCQSRMPRLGASRSCGMVAGLTRTGWMLLQHSHGKGVGIVLSGERKSNQTALNGNYFHQYRCPQGPNSAANTIWPRGINYIDLESSNACWDSPSRELQYLFPASLSAKV